MSLPLPTLECPSPTSSTSSAPSPLTPPYYPQEYAPFDSKHMISPYSSPSPPHENPFYFGQPPAYYTPPPPQSLHHHHHHHHHSSPSLSPVPSNAQSKTYSFVSLPGNAVKKRPRRRYDEIERPYRCNWGDCDKAYGTLNHLNNHVVLQSHGEKRNPAEFKELRMQLKLKKKGLMASQPKQEPVASLLAPPPPQQEHPQPMSSPTYHVADSSMLYVDTTSPYHHHHQQQHPRNMSSYELGYPPPQPSYTSSTQYDYSSYSPSSSSSCRHSAFMDTYESPREMWPRNSLPANSTLFTPLPGYNDTLEQQPPSLLPTLRGSQMPTAYRYEGESSRPTWSHH